MVINLEWNSCYCVVLCGYELGVNFCECMDFKMNGLGICKYIEWVLYKLYYIYGNKQYFCKLFLEWQYSLVYLVYGEEWCLWFCLGGEEVYVFGKLARQYFDEDGVLYEYVYLDFDQFLEQVQAVFFFFWCYLDVLDFIIQKWVDVWWG